MSIQASFGRFFDRESRHTQIFHPQKSSGGLGLGHAARHPSRISSLVLKRTRFFFFFAFSEKRSDVLAPDDALPFACPVFPRVTRCAVLKRPDPSASDGKNGARPKPKPKPKAKVASEKEQEVAEALFDLANLAALAGGDEAAPAKRKRARGKKDAAGDGADGAKAAKPETENGDAVPGTVPAGVPGGFPGAAANPLQALFSNPTAMSAMASQLYGAPGAAAAMHAGWPPGFDIQSMAAALGGAPPPPPPPPSARPPGALKLCAAHVYIAHFIDYQQQMSRYSLLAKPMDPAAGPSVAGAAGPSARGGGALAPETTVSAPPAQDPPAVAAARGGFGDQSPRWPAQMGQFGQMGQMGPPGAAFAQGALPGGPGDFTQAHQFAALQALMGQSMAGGGMPFAFPGMPAAANPFAGMMGAGGPAGPGAAEAQMPPGGAEAMAAMAAQMDQAQVYPPQAQAPPWAAPPAMPAVPAAPAAEAAPAPAAPAEAGAAPASEGAEAKAEAEAEAKPEPEPEANGDAGTAAEADAAEPPKEDLPAEGAAVPAPA